MKKMVLFLVMFCFMLVAGTAKGGPLDSLWYDGCPALVLSEYDSIGTMFAVGFNTVDPCSLRAISFFSYGVNDTLGVEIEIVIWTNSNGYPGEELCRVHYLVMDTTHYSWVTVNIPNLRVEESFFTGFYLPVGAPPFATTDELIGGGYSMVWPDSLRGWEFLENNLNIRAYVEYLSTEVRDEEGQPNIYKLGNYPNPFNTQTKIIFSLSKTEEVDLTIYNILGQKAATLFTGQKSAGKHIVSWDADEFSSGVYFSKLVVGQEVTINKMTLLK